MLFFAIASRVSAQEQVDIQQLQQSAQQGDAESQFRLVQCYEQGNGVDKNYNIIGRTSRKSFARNHLTKWQTMEPTVSSTASRLHAKNL